MNEMQKYLLLGILLLFAGLFLYFYMPTRTYIENHQTEIIILIIAAIVLYWWLTRRKKEDDAICDPMFSLKLFCSTPAAEKNGFNFSKIGVESFHYLEALDYNWLLIFSPFAYKNNWETVYSLVLNGKMKHVSEQDTNLVLFKDGVYYPSEFAKRGKAGMNEEKLRKEVRSQIEKKKIVDEETEESGVSQ